MNQISDPRRVFITGALGFIGRQLVYRYREAGATVAGVDIHANSELYSNCIVDGGERRREGEANSPAFLPSGGNRDNY